MTPKHISTPNLASLWLAGLLPLIFLNETFNLLPWDFFEIVVPLFFVLSDLALSHRTRGKSKGKHLSPRQHLFFSHCFLFSLPQNVGTSRNQEQEIFHNLSVRRQVITNAGIVSSPSLAQVVWFLKRMERRLGSSHHRDHVAHVKYGCRKEQLSLAWKFVTKCPFCITWLLNHLYQYMAPSAEYHGNGYRGLRTQKRRMFMFTHSPLADTETSESRPGIKVFLEAVLLCTVFSISF